MLNKDEIHKKKLIEELMQKQAAQNENTEILSPESNDLPPSDLPPVFLGNDLPPERLPPKLLDEKGIKLLKTLENKFIEFFKVGDDLSGKADILPDLLAGITSNLDQGMVSKMGEEGEIAFITFIQYVEMSALALSKLKDPVPTLSEQTLSNLHLADIHKTFLGLRNSLVNPEQNQIFKTRAISCVLLTLAFGKLIKCQKDIFNKVDNDLFSFMGDLLISPVQRLAQLGLFANDTLVILEKLKDCDGILDSDKEIIDDTLIVLQELLCRSKLIGLVTNSIKEAVDLVAMDTLEKRFSKDSLQQLEFFKTLVPAYVQLTMEAEFNPDLIKQITDKLNLELESQLTLNSAKLYRKVCRLIEASKSEPEALAQDIKKLKSNLHNDLCTIHEDITLDDNTKLENMLAKVRTTDLVLSNKLTALGKTFSYWFSTPQSDFGKDLKIVLKNQIEMAEKAVIRI